jgi:hypothetical protein
MNGSSYPDNENRQDAEGPQAYKMKMSGAFSELI